MKWGDMVARLESAWTSPQWLDAATQHERLEVYEMC